MSADIRSAKAALRQEILERLRGLTPAERRLASAEACALLRTQPAWRRAQSVLLYAPMEGELDIWPLAASALESGKRLSLPRYSRDADIYTACEVADLDAQVRQGWHRIREPISHCPITDLNTLDFILVPAIAFDVHGCRLGRGKGYYDRLLAGLRGQTCGAGFDLQIVPKVPVAPHDIRLNCILTPTRWIESSPRPVLE